MFDSVGRTIDAEAGRRGFAAAALSIGLTGAVLGLTVVAGAYKVARHVLDDTDDLVMVEVVVDEPGLDESLLPPPPPPPPPPAAAPDPEQEDDAKEVPDEMDETVAELDDDIEEDVTSEAAAPGVPEGQEGGVVGGVEGGVVGGVVGGVIGGQLSDSPRIFHHSELRVKRRVPFDYPLAAHDMGLGETDCRVRIFIDEQGIPYSIGIEACPLVFHDAIQTGLRGWRWYPARVNSERVRAQFLMVVRFIP